MLKIKILPVSLLFVLIIYNTGCAQENITKSKGINSDISYFGQKRPGSIPEVFAPGVVSTEEFEFGGTFTPDGKEYFFTRRLDYAGSANRIYYTQLLNGSWTTPVLAPFAVDVFEFEPVMSPDGGKLYFFSERIGSRDMHYDGDLWVSEKSSSGWSNATYFLSLVNKKWCMSVSPSLNGTLYFTSDYGGKRGIYKAENINDLYQSVEYLNDEINSTYYSHPYIAPDESFMLMDSQPTGRGKPELFISYKMNDDSWTTPTNMGSIINSTKTEFGASVSPDGKYLFFHRRLNGNGDIYWVDAQIIQELKVEVFNKK